MKITLTQEQLINLIELIVKQSTDDEVEMEIGEQEGEGGSTTPDVGKWESGVQRGAANQLGATKWSDSYGLTRGKANPLW